MGIVKEIYEIVGETIQQLNETSKKHNMKLSEKIEFFEDIADNFAEIFAIKIEKMKLKAGVIGMSKSAIKKWEQDKRRKTK